MQIARGQAAALGLRRKFGKTWNQFSYVFGHRPCRGTTDPATLALPIASFGGDINPNRSLGGLSGVKQTFPVERGTRYRRQHLMQSAKGRTKPTGNLYWIWGCYDGSPAELQPFRTAEPPTDLVLKSVRKGEFGYPRIAQALIGGLAYPESIDRVSGTNTWPRLLHAQPIYPRHSPVGC